MEDKLREMGKQFSTVRHIEGTKEEEEKHQWEKLDAKDGFHDREEDLISESWNVREAIKAIKDEEID